MREGTIASVSEENSASAQEVGISAQEMSAQVEEVAASAQSLREMAQGLLQLVTQFKLATVETEMVSDEFATVGVEEIAPEPILSKYDEAYSEEEAPISSNGRY